MQNQYTIFCDSQIITDTMIDYTKTSEPTEFKFEPNQTAKTLRYGYKVPDTPNGKEQSTWHSASF